MQKIFKRNIKKCVKKIIGVNWYYAKKSLVFGILGFLCIHACAANVPIAILDLAVKTCILVFE